jgi:hypothetical protein
VILDRLVQWLAASPGSLGFKLEPHSRQLYFRFCLAIGAIAIAIAIASIAIGAIEARWGT